MFNKKAFDSLLVYLALLVPNTGYVAAAFIMEKSFKTVSGFFIRW